MSRERWIGAQPARWFSLAVIVAVFSRAIWIFTRPPQEVVAYFPDDLFYYLGAVRSLWNEGTWGSTGFHPAWGMILAAVQAGPGLAAWFSLMLSFWALVMFWMKPPGDEGGHLALAVMVSAPAFCLNAVSGMEFGLALFLGGLLWLALLDRGKHLKRFIPAIVFFGFLARPEFGIMAVALTLAVRRPSWNYPGSVRLSIRRAYAEVSHVLAAAGAAFVFEMIWNTVISGDIISTSARMKVFWSEVYDWEWLTRRDLYLTLKHLTGIDTFPAAPYILGAILAMALWKNWPLAVGAFSLLWVLCRLEWVQLWHVSAIFPLFLVLLAALLDPFEVAGTMRRALVGVAVVLVVVNLVGTFRASPPYPQNLLQLKAAQTIHEKEVVGAWNSGVLSWYAAGKVVNLDGLVNDPVQRYILEDRLDQYLERQGIKKLVDYDSTLLSQLYRVRGGYSGGLPATPGAVVGGTREFGALRFWSLP